MTCKPILAIPRNSLLGIAATAVIRDGVIRSHRPRVCGDVVNLYMKIGADRAARDPVALAVEVSGCVEIGRDSIRRQVGVISVADRVVAPECCRCVKVLIHAAKQIDIGAVACGTKPATRRRKWSDRRPGMVPGSYL